ncbi:hypothetical protein M885DRAFT_614468 [Pelagophyceae sp. CCMP2097]|nr:hypothetical protein M885DRAFT_614468 [Pelagophyceae sp. CCMP2097]
MEPESTDPDAARRPWLAVGAAPPDVQRHAAAHAAASHAAASHLAASHSAAAHSAASHSAAAHSAAAHSAAGGLCPAAGGLRRSASAPHADLPGAAGCVDAPARKRSCTEPREEPLSADGSDASPKCRRTRQVPSPRHRAFNNRSIFCPMDRAFDLAVPAVTPTGKAPATRGMPEQSLLDLLWKPPRVAGP